MFIMCGSYCRVLRGNLFPRILFTCINYNKNNSNIISPMVQLPLVGQDLLLIEVSR